jgi:hypothetical protein
MLPVVRRRRVAEGSLWPASEQTARHGGRGPVNSAYSDRLHDYRASRVAGHPVSFGSAVFT